MPIMADAARDFSDHDPVVLDRLRTEDLDLIEAAIFRLLKIQQQAQTPLSTVGIPDSVHLDGAGAEELGFINVFSSCSDPEGEHCSRSRVTPDAAIAAHAGKDFGLLVKLFEQVQGLKSLRYSKDRLQKHEKPEIRLKPPPMAKAHERGEAENRDGNDLKEATEAALKAAMAAADAAKAAAASVAKNSEAIKTLLKTLSTQPEEVQDESLISSLPQQSEENQEKHRSEKKKNEEDIGKVLEKQNRVTHWILGFMVVATTIWRFKIIQLASKFQHVITNPFESLGGIFSEGGSKFDHHHHHHFNPLLPDREEGEGSQAPHLPVPLPHLELPSILQQNEVETHKERSRFVL